MWNIVMSAFLSFAVIGGSYVDVSQPSVENYSTTPNHEITCPQGDCEIENHRLWNGVGRHEMLRIKSAPQFIGHIPVQYFFPMHEIAIMNGTHFTEEYTTVTTTSVSTSYELRVGATQGLAAEIKLDGASLSQSGSMTQTYTINNSITYTTAKTTSDKLEYDINSEWFEGKYQYTVGVVAYTYKIQAETWAWDDYWWADYEVEGSRHTFDIYVTVDPAVTLIFSDRTFVYEKALKAY